MKQFILALVAIIGCSTVVQSSTNTKTVGGEASYVFPVEVSSTTIGGRTYHVFNSRNWGRVFDVTNEIQRGPAKDFGGNNAQ